MSAIISLNPVRSLIHENRWVTISGDNICSLCSIDITPTFNTAIIFNLWVTHNRKHGLLNSRTTALCSRICVVSFLISITSQFYNGLQNHTLGCHGTYSNIEIRWLDPWTYKPYEAANNHADLFDGCSRWYTFK